MKRVGIIFANVRFAILTVGLFGTVLWLHSISYLLFHTTAEIFSSIIAFCLFIISWNTRKFSENQFILFLGLAFLSVGIIDIVHALAYKGMNILPVDGANAATQLWIGARGIEAASLLIAPFYFTRPLKYNCAIAGYFLVTVLLFLSIFYLDAFPDCYREASGLTPFKKGAEYGIVLTLSLALFYLSWRRKHLPQNMYVLLCAVILVTLLSELTFTFYVGVYDFFNQMGHLLKLLAFILIYRATVEITLSRPVENMFSQLKQSRDTQEKLVGELQDTLSHIKQLQGFLPICANCKKIRDDEGYWQKIESYISSHSDTQFSHSICPTCAQELYPDVAFADAPKEDEPPADESDESSGLV